MNLHIICYNLEFLFCLFIYFVEFLSESLLVQNFPKKSNVFADVEVGLTLVEITEMLQITSR